MNEREMKKKIWLRLWSKMEYEIGREDAENLLGRNVTDAEFRRYRRAVEKVGDMCWRKGRD